VHVISVDGTSFKRYFDLAKILKIRVAAIRDNDGAYLKTCVDTTPTITSPRSKYLSPRTISGPPSKFACTRTTQSLAKTPYQGVRLRNSQSLILLSESTLQRSSPSSPSIQPNCYGGFQELQRIQMSLGGCIEAYHPRRKEMNFVLDIGCARKFVVEDASLRALSPES